MTAGSSELSDSDESSTAVESAEEPAAAEQSAAAEDDGPAGGAEAAAGAEPVAAAAEGHSPGDEDAEGSNDAVTAGSSGSAEASMAVEPLAEDEGASPDGDEDAEGSDGAVTAGSAESGEEPASPEDSDVGTAAEDAEPDEVSVPDVAAGEDTLGEGGSSPAGEREESAVAVLVAEEEQPDAEPVVEEKPAARAAPQPERPKRGRGRKLLVAVPVVLALLVGVGWAVDSATSSGQVGRNVEIADRAVGGLEETEVRNVVAELAASQTDRPVTIQSGDKTYQSTAAALGLTLDQDATVDAVLDVGRDGNPITRPFRWVASWFGTREVEPRYQLDESLTAASLEVLQGADRVAPVEPAMQLTDTGLVLAKGQNGTGLDPEAFADELLAAAEEAHTGEIVIDLEPTSLPPRFDDRDAQDLTEQANEITTPGLAVKAAGLTVPVPAQELRSWMTLVPASGNGNRPELAVNPDTVKAALPRLVGPIGEPAVNATVTLDEATQLPVVVPGRDGVTCCTDDSGTRVLDALKAGKADVELEVAVAQPEWTTEEVQAWGVTQPIGGARGWQNGHEVPGPAPGFTTWHDCCASRVRNIQRLADLVRGAVIPPGAEFSINDYVGPRTSAKGFVLAGAIAQGMHVDEIGGGVSQFATTTFNAAYFAGLDILEYQAHTEYFSRYPRGREATMGYPKPDLRIRNNTPYGLMIWTSYTGTSLTVTFYSTPWANAEQTGISEGRHGACRTVVTTRTRWFPDGTTAEDQFKATYRPGEGQFC